MNSNIEKQNIMYEIKSGDQNDITYRKIDSYLEKYSGDTDMIINKAYLLLLSDNVEEGIERLEFVLQKCPFSVDALFLLGQAYNEVKRYYDALICMGMSEGLSDFYKDVDWNFFNREICLNIINNVINDVVNSSELSVNEKHKILNCYKNGIENFFWLFNDVVRTPDDIIGHYFSNRLDEICFFGLYDPWDLSFYNGENNKNLLLFKTELLKQLQCGTKMSFELKSDALVPILPKENVTALEIMNCDEEAHIRIDYGMHFNYYRLKKGSVKIQSDKELVVAEPVELVHHKQNKKLVISLFVDGISQKVIDEYGLENIMPNTYRFFSKGMGCRNAFSSSDWTYPSLASLISGLSVPNHMMISPDINIKYPRKQKILFEYFKEAGYHTTIISGDWRSTSATYDSIRGVDRYMAKHQNCGFRTEDVLVNVIDNIETFKETDQYIWVGTGDLHDVADEINLPSAVQAKMSLSDYDMDEKSKTSVKQKYSPNKISTYVKVATHVDSKLKVLYDYIEENYDEDEFVVTLFGDHGQGYIVKPDEFHLSRGLSNIGFMTRGGGVSGTTDEYINIVDYTNIITRLAGIQDVQILSDGKLPKAYGGMDESKYAITETIHPGDPYMVAIHSEKYVFYMESLNNVTNYGKVDMSEYRAHLYDSEENEINDDALKMRFINFILDRTKYIQIY